MFNFIAASMMVYLLVKERDHKLYFGRIKLLMEIAARPKLGVAVLFPVRTYRKSKAPCVLSAIHQQRRMHLTP
jgi:hypothetical protein